MILELSSGKSAFSADECIANINKIKPDMAPDEFENFLLREFSNETLEKVRNNPQFDAIIQNI